MADEQARDVEFDLHHLLGVRLENPSEKDLAVVAGHLGVSPARLDRNPDVTIRFVDQLKRSSTLKYLDPDEAGFADDAFLVLRGKSKTSIRVQVNFDQVGKQCEIVCEHGVPAVPLLTPILNLTALARGLLPVHAAAFDWNGAGTLVTGWAKGGKTTMLLAFMANGARFIGDEWIYLDPGGRSMYGLPEPLHVKEWHLRDLPQYRARVPSRDLRQLGAAKLASRLEQSLSKNRLSRRAFGGVLKRVRPMLKERLQVTVPALTLFAEQAGNSSGQLDKVLLVTSHDSPEIVVRPVDPEEVARRMAFSLQFEDLHMRSYYLAYRYAFPHQASALIENVEDLQRERLSRVLAGKTCFSVFHPYPVGVHALYQAVCPYL